MKDPISDKRLSAQTLSLRARVPRASQKTPALLIETDTQFSAVRLQGMRLFFRAKKY